MMHIEEAVFDIPEYLLECEDVKVYNNTYHKKGINNKNEKEILWWDNQQLKWLQGNYVKIVAERDLQMIFGHYCKTKLDKVTV